MKYTSLTPLSSVFFLYTNYIYIGTIIIQTEKNYTLVEM